MIKATECGPSLSRQMSSRLARSLAHTHKIVFVIPTLCNSRHDFCLFIIRQHDNSIEFSCEEIDNFFIYCHFLHSFTLFFLLLFDWIFSASIFQPSMIIDKPRNYFMCLVLCDCTECLQRDIEVLWDLYLVTFLHYALHSNLP